MRSWLLLIALTLTSVGFADHRVALSNVSGNTYLCIDFPEELEEWEVDESSPNPFGSHTIQLSPSDWTKSEGLLLYFVPAFRDLPHSYLINAAMEGLNQLCSDIVWKESELNQGDLFFEGTSPSDKELFFLIRCIETDEGLFGLIYGDPENGSTCDQETWRQALLQAQLIGE